MFRAKALAEQLGSVSWPPPDTQETVSNSLKLASLDRAANIAYLA